MHRDAAPVRSGAPYPGVGKEIAQSVARELQLVVPNDRARLEDRMRRRAQVVPIAGERDLLRRRVATDSRRALEDQHAQTSAREIRRGDEAVVPGACDHDVEFGHWRRSRNQSAMAGRYLYGMLLQTWLPSG